MDEHVIVVDSLSKRYSACGVRLGCLVTRNREVHQAAMKMAQGRLSAPGLAQVIAVGARELGPEYTQGIVVEYQKRRDILFEGLSAIPGVFLRKPEGAFYFVARLPVRDSEDFASWLLTDFQKDGATVMVAPAPGFYATAGPGRRRGAHRLRAEGGRPAGVGRRSSAAALPAYARARGWSPRRAPARARRRRPTSTCPPRAERAAGRHPLPDPIRVSEAVTVPGSALAVAFTRSSGPGGQNVNKVASKVELRVDLSRHRGASRGRAARGCAPDRVAGSTRRAGSWSPASAPATSTATWRTRGPKVRDLVGPRAAGAEAAPPHARDQGVAGSAPQGQEARVRR